MARKLRDILTEAPWINPDIENDRHTQNQFSDWGEHISNMPKGYKVIKHDLGESDDGRFTTYTVRDANDNAHIKVHGNQKGNRFDVSALYAAHGNKVKAHELYHHLIMHHGLHIHSDYEQSEGGMKVWKRLQKMPGIHMQSWNGSDQKYRELKPSFQRTYDMDSSTRLAAKKRGT